MPFDPTLLALAVAKAKSSQVDTQVDHDLRTRFERKIDRDLNQDANDNRSDLLYRYRLGLTMSSGKTSARIAYQWIGDVAWTRALNSSQSEGDFLLANVSHTFNKTKVTAGRQRISILDDRLISPSDWSLNSRSWDAVRIENGKTDAFVGRLAIGRNNPDDTILGGLYHKLSNWTLGYIYKTSKPNADRDVIHTLNVHKRDQFGSWAAKYEAAFQSGAVAGRSHRAYALHGEIARKVNKTDTVTFLGDFATGGGDANNTNTFDPIFGSNDKLYGKQELERLRNAQLLAVRYQRDFNKQTNARLSYFKYWLQDSRDGWYATGSRPYSAAGVTYIDPTGAAGNDLGSELDFEVTHRLDSKITLNAGIGLFMPGTFQRRVAPRSDRSTFLFFMLDARF